MGMKKLIYVVILGAFLAGSAPAFSSQTRQGPAFRKDSAATLKKKVCERCKRGADGKMECKEEACPK